MGYNIKEVSRELGVTEKSILRRVKGSDFQNFIYRENGVTYIKDEGVKYILNNLSKEEMFIENITRISEIEESKVREIENINKEVEILKLQNEHLEDRVKFFEETLLKREKEMVELKKKLKEMDGLERRYNKLYGNMTNILRKDNKVKVEDKKPFWRR